MTSEYFISSGISLIAEIGGYGGLLLGFSLFNLTELSDYFLQAWKRVLNKSRINIMSGVSEVKPYQ